MKKFLSYVALICIAAFSLLSCTKESDSSSGIEGVYTGQLLYGTEVVEDAYVVSITRVSSEVVSVNAEFFNGSLNFNVQKTANGYNLVSSTVYNVQITVYGKMLTINYQSSGGSMLTFQGKRD